jgi:TonB family protein
LPGRQLPATGPQADPFRSNPILRGSEVDGTASRKRLLAWSVGLHLLLAATVLTGALLLPEREVEPEKIDIVFYQAPPEPVKVAEPPKPKAKPAPKPKPEPVAVAEVVPPKPEVKPEPKPKPKPIPEPIARNEPPKPAPKVEPKPEPTRTVQTAVLNEPKPTPVAAAPRPERNLRTGGFGSTETPTKPAPAPARARTLAAGGFGSDSEKAPSPRPATRPRVVSNARFNGGAVTAPSRQSPAERSVVADSFREEVRAAAPGESRRQGEVIVASTGFGASPSADPGSGKPSGTVREGGFATEIQAPRPRKRESAPASIETPVEIVSKPKPVYTDEARRNHVEGEVVLEVTFDAGGRLRVLRVVGGLGHGLDEAAIAAAEKIRFTPAKRNGQPVDYTATLRVVFRLA